MKNYWVGLNMNLRNGKRLVVFLTIIGLIMIFSLSSLRDFDKSVNNINHINSDPENKQKLSSSGDGLTFYRGQIAEWAAYDDFQTSLVNWSNEQSYYGAISQSDGKVIFNVSGPILTYSNYPKLILQPKPFQGGNITLNWYTAYLDSGEQLEIRYRYQGEAWDTHSPLLTTNSESPVDQSVLINASTHHTNEDNFELAVVLKASRTSGSSEEGHLDWFKLAVWEFEITESNDQIPQQNTQTIFSYVCPYDNDSSIDEVYLNYSKSSSLANPIKTSCTPFLGGYIAQIPDTYYIYGENIYYKFVYRIGSTNYSSHTSNYPFFNTTDNTTPVFENATRNYASQVHYNQSDFQISVDIRQIAGDSNIVNVSLFMSNNSGVTLGSPHILTSTSLPQSGNTTYLFNVGAQYLAYPNFYYKFYAEDAAGLFQFSSEYSITVNDSYAPEFSGHSITQSGKPNYNDTIFVNYTVFEPEDASGFSSYTNVELRYYIGEMAPSTPNQYTGILYNKTTSPFSRTGGNIQFEFPSSLKYGDTVYYWINCSDSAGNRVNDFALAHYFYVNDTYSPSINKSALNDQNTNYYENKILSFNITEEADAAGVKDSSIVFYFKVDSNDFSTDAKTITSFTKVGINYTFTIFKEGNFTTIGQTIYYKINGTDNAIVPNIFQMTGSFLILDLEAPFINYISGLSNDTDTEYNKDVRIVFNSDEWDSVGSGFRTIYLLIKNSSNPVEGQSDTIKLNYNTNSSKNYIFIISYTYLSARLGEELYWNVTAQDMNWNNRSLTGRIDPKDFVKPTIVWDFDTSSSGYINYNQSLEVNFTIAEPRSGRGFTSSDNLKIFYYIDTGSGAPADPSVGIPINYIGTLTVGGGTYKIVLPETIYSYNQKIWYWGNVSDGAGNWESTFGTLHYIIISDTHKSNLNILSSSLASSSYNMSKVIAIYCTEPADASGIFSLIVYYGVENPSVSSSSYNGSVSWLNVNATGGYIYLNLPIYATIGNYSKRIYFRVYVTDVATNVNVSSVNSFLITDGVGPTLIQDSANVRAIMNNENGKTLKITAWDSDIPNVSGMSSILLYYRLNNSAVGTGVNQYNGTLNIRESISRYTQKEYTFRLEYANTYLWKNGTVFYYIIVMQDFDGNINITSVSGFLIINPFTKNFISPVSANPSKSEYYYNTETIHLYFTTNVACELWYYINGIDPEPDNHIFGTVFSRDVALPHVDGKQNITIFYFDTLYNETREFYLDFTKPLAVIITNCERTNSGFIEIQWILQETEELLTSYEIWRKEGNGPYQKMNTFGVGTRTYIDYYVTSGKTYQYKIVVVDRAGNKSLESISNSVSTPLPFYFWIALGGAAAVSGVVLMKIRSKTKTKRSLKELGNVTKEEQEMFAITDQDLSPEAIEERKRKIKAMGENVFEDESEIKEDQWKSIDWKSKATPAKPKEAFPGESQQFFWKQNINLMVDAAAKLELEGKLAEAVKIYNLAMRAAELDKTADPEIRDFIKEKLVNIYSNPLKDQ